MLSSLASASCRLRLLISLCNTSISFSSASSASFCFRFSAAFFTFFRCRFLRFEGRVCTAMFRGVTNFMRKGSSTKSLSSRVVVCICAAIDRSKACGIPLAGSNKLLKWTVSPTENLLSWGHRKGASQPNIFRVSLQAMIPKPLLALRCLMMPT